MQVAEAEALGWKGDEAVAFAKWRTDVDRHIYRLAGVTSDDIADYDYAIAYEAGRKALSVARSALGSAGFPFDE